MKVFGTLHEAASPQMRQSRFREARALIYMFLDLHHQVAYLTKFYGR